MADLIIKPSVGTDNKLIIQNQAGNAVLTTDNSGVTLTNANLANANNVYPDNHLVFLGTDAGSSTTSSPTSPTATGLTVTVVQATVAKFSKIVINWQAIFRIKVGSSHCLGQIRCYRNYGAGTESLLFDTSNIGTNGTTLADQTLNVGGTVIDESLAAADSTYEFYFLKGGAANAGDMTFGTPSRINLFGII
jgi:hypothetical protein